METAGIIAIVAASLAISLTISYFLIRNAVKAANSELLRFIKVLVKLKGAENKKLYDDIMKEVELSDLQKKRDYYSKAEYHKRQQQILQRYDNA